MPSSTSGSPNAARLVRDPEVGGERQLEPAAETPAVDGRDRRHGQRGDPLVDVAGIRVVGGDRGSVRVGELVDVRSGGEGLPRPCEDDAAASADIVS